MNPTEQAEVERNAKAIALVAEMAEEAEREMEKLREVNAELVEVAEAFERAHQCVYDNGCDLCKAARAALGKAGAL